MHDGGGRRGKQPQRDGDQGAMNPEIAAEAAVWIARLHGPDRSKRMERDCLAWQAKSPAHRLAFERCTDLWMDVAGVDRAAVAKAASEHSQAEDADDAAQDHRIRALMDSPRARKLVLAVLAMVAGTAVMVTVQPWRATDHYDTGVGEQRLVVLQDGTRMTLNTATQLKVHLSARERGVTVERGEALFEVAKDVHRPFVVRAAEAEVTATGTAFLVRRDLASTAAPDAVAVTLVEGQVVVRGTGDGVVAQEIAQPIVMAAGERLRLSGVRATGQGRAAAAAAAGALPQKDRPRVDQMLAWKRGEVVFEHTPLAQAVAEMNRYGKQPVVLAGELAFSGKQVSGVFRVADIEGFAQALAALHGLSVKRYEDRLELVRHEAQ